MKSSGDGLLRLIAVFKFFKAAALIALGVGLFRLLHRDLGSTLEHWCEALRLDPGSRFLYAGLFLAEGTGLWLRKRWGEWLTVIITSSLVPVEIYEIHRHPTWVKIAVLLVNVAIVVYLIYHMRKRAA